MKALLIDHDDSFSQNLKHWLLPLFEKVKIVNHRDEGLVLLQDGYDVFVFSPGPKSPKDYPQSLQLLQRLKPATFVYGVCLGVQMMAEASGHSVSVYSPPKHGKVSNLKILDSEFQRFENSAVARYHSIKLDDGLEKSFRIIAQDHEQSFPMWVVHREKNWMGVQFHPESFLTSLPQLHLQALHAWLK